MKLRLLIADDPYERGTVEWHVSDDMTLSMLRDRMQATLQGHPAPDAIRLIVEGRALGLARGAEKLQDVFTELQKVSSLPDAYPLPR
jgi:hypothetical protein